MVHSVAETGVQESGAEIDPQQFGTEKIVNEPLMDFFQNIDPEVLKQILGLEQLRRETTTTNEGTRRTTSDELPNYRTIHADDQGCYAAEEETPKDDDDDQKADCVKTGAFEMTNKSPSCSEMLTTLDDCKHGIPATIGSVQPHGPRNAQFSL